MRHLIRGESSILHEGNLLLFMLYVLHTSVYRWPRVHGHAANAENENRISSTWYTYPVYGLYFRQISGGGGGANELSELRTRGVDRETLYNRQIQYRKIDPTARPGRVAHLLHLSHLFSQNYIKLRGK